MEKIQKQSYPEVMNLSTLSSINTCFLMKVY